MTDAEFDALFTTSRPIVFAYHGYPWLIHRLTYRRTNHANLHVRGYKEEGTTTTPFDMVMLNDLDRFHLVMDVIDRVPGLASQAGHVRQLMVDSRLEARAYTRREGEDLPAIRDWTWPRMAEVASPRVGGAILVVNAGSSTLKLSVVDPMGSRPGGSRRSKRVSGRACPRGRGARDRGDRAASTPSVTASSTAATAYSAATRRRRRGPGPASSP